MVSRNRLLASNVAALTTISSQGAEVVQGDSAPASPNTGDLWFDTNELTLYTYYTDDSDVSHWVSTQPSGTVSGGGTSIVQSDSPPSSPSAGDLWYDTNELSLYTYYTDDSGTSQWVSTQPSGTVSSSSGGSGVTTYANLTARDAASPSEGDLAYITSTDHLYIYNGSAWDRVYVGAQENVGWDSELPSSYTLKIGDSATNFSVSATDPDGFDITYSYTTSPSDISSFATITQRSGDSSNSFDILPDSAGTGTFTFRVTADDGVSKIATSSNISVLASQLLTGLDTGTGGTAGTTTYTASGGMVVTAPGPVYNNGSLYYLYYLFDGANDTGNNDDIWLTDGGTSPGYLTVDLSNHTSPFGGNISYIEKIVVYPKVGAALTTFTNVEAVEWSTDGTNWTQAYGDQGWTDSLSLGYSKEFLINKSAAYFRLKLARSGSWGFSMHGLEIYAG